MDPRRLKSGLLKWRYLSPRQKRAETRKYGSIKAAQSARRVLPINRLTPKGKQRFIKRYGSISEANRQRRIIRAERVNRPPVISPPPELELPTAEGGFEAPLPTIEEVVRERAETKNWNDPNDRMSREEWREYVSDRVGFDVALEDTRLWAEYKRKYRDASEPG